MVSLIVKASNVQNEKVALAGWNGNGYLLVEHFADEPASQRRLKGNDVVFRRGVGGSQSGVDDFLIGVQVQAGDLGTDRDAIAGDRQFLDKSGRAQLFFQFVEAALYHL